MLLLSLFSPSSLRTRRLGRLYTSQSPLLLRVASGSFSPHLSPRPHTARATATANKESTPNTSGADTTHEFTRRTSLQRCSSVRPETRTSVPHNNLVLPSSPSLSLPKQQHDHDTEDTKIGELKQVPDGYAIPSTHANLLKSVSVALERKFEDAIDAVDNSYDATFMSAQSSLGEPRRRLGRDPLRDFISCVSCPVMRLRDFT